MGAAILGLLAVHACAASGPRAMAAQAGGGGSPGGAEPAGSRAKWLKKDSVLLIRDFVSKQELLSLRTTADRLFAVDNGPRWQEAAYNTAFLQGPHVRELLTDEVMVLERRIENITGIAMHREEALLMFTRSRPGSLPPGESLRNVHHDKNTAERRTVTVLLYLSSTKSNADGGHTIFPTLPLKRKNSNAAEVPGGSREVGSATAGNAEKDKDPMPYLRKAFKGGFKSGRRALSGGMLDGQPGELWDKKAWDLLRRECNLALEGRSHVLAVRPKRGAALVFWHVQSDGTPDPLAWHAACTPVNGGPRYTAQKFKEPPLGYALEDQTSEGHPAATREL